MIADLEAFVSRNFAPGTVGTVKVQALRGAALDEVGDPSGESNVLHVAAGWRVSVKALDAEVEEGEGAAIEFVVTLNSRDDCRTVTVDYATAMALPRPGMTTSPLPGR